MTPTIDCLKSEWPPPYMHSLKTSDPPPYILPPPPSAEIYEQSLRRLELVQDSAARLLTGTSRRAHITPVLRELHWLPVARRITYKVLCLVYKALHEISSSCLLEITSVWAWKWISVAPQCCDHSGGTSFLQKLWWQSIRGLRTQDVEFPSIASQKFHKPGLF